MQPPDPQPPDPDWQPDPDWPPGSIPFDPLWAKDPGFDQSQSGGCGGGGSGTGSASEWTAFWASPRGPVSMRQAPENVLLEGFTGSLGLSGVSGLDQDLTGAALQDLRLLEGWTAAAKARLVHRQHLLMIEELDRFGRQRDAEQEAEREAAGLPAPERKERAQPGRDRSLAFSLTVTEIATLFRIPEGTAMALVEESEELCTRCPETLHQLETGAITLAQSRTILDQTRSLLNPAPAAGEASDNADTAGDGAGSDGADTGSEPENTPDARLKDQSGVDPAPLFPPGAAAALEQELLTLAPELTNAQLTRKARRLRERSFPQSIPVRHRTAFEQRRVWFQPKPDGMGHLTAYLPAPKGQQIYGALTGAARGEQAQGDPRGLDELRTDILASLLLHTPEPWIGAAPGSSDRGNNQDKGEDGQDKGKDPDLPDGDVMAGPAAGNHAERGDAGPDDAGSEDTDDSYLPGLPPGTVAEIMVLINADTLFGADDAPAELAGYGPITAEAARRLARTALRWTGLVQDRATGQILGVGRRRKVPAGLRRWLQARDQTCRFPGCSTGTSRAEADHTIPWAAGGPTEHWNLANLCKKHHLFKTLGHWKARQVSPGVLEWISPLGRHYSTQPELTLSQQDSSPDSSPDSPPDRAGAQLAAGTRPPGGRVSLGTVFSGGHAESGEDLDDPAPF